MSFNLSELFERVVDAVARPGGRSSAPAGALTYAELDERANRLAHHLAPAGIGAGDHVGLQLLNGTEYLEAMLAAFKLRAVPINVNYRYVERELRHLFDDADLVGVVVARQFAARVAAVRRDAATLQHLVVVDDGTERGGARGRVAYEDALAAAVARAAASPGRSGDDLLLRLHRRHHRHAEGRPVAPRGHLLRRPRAAATRHWTRGRSKTPTTCPSGSPTSRSCSCAHRRSCTSAPTGAPSTRSSAAARWSCSPRARSTPAEVWALVERRGSTSLTVVGDAMARPLLDALAERARPLSTRRACS